VALSGGAAPDDQNMRDRRIEQALAQHALPDHAGRAEQNDLHAGLKRRNTRMIMTTKNTSTMPCTTPKTGPAGGSPGASSCSVGILRKLWITSTNTLRYSEASAVTT